ncbi:hypothetical protein K438DRAFT_1768347 [Mycena galopus ATCC 62051]|nr:hypothetical protein K438DRAFT_1780568 [Mycena galopus ATCC 62051]KAF8180812.1 hypothetical protein K438DRAFT_1768347 [Mycena galopus ATCC 62051]
MYVPGRSSWRIQERLGGIMMANAASRRSEFDPARRTGRTSSQLEIETKREAPSARSRRRNARLKVRKGNKKADEQMDQSQRRGSTLNAEAPKLAVPKGGAVPEAAGLQDIHLAEVGAILSLNRCRHASVKDGEYFCERAGSSVRRKRRAKAVAVTMVGKRKSKTELTAVMAW